MRLGDGYYSMRIPIVVFVGQLELAIDWDVLQYQEHTISFRELA